MYGLAAVAIVVANSGILAAIGVDKVKVIA